MTADQIVSRVCARFGKQDESFKTQVRAEINPCCEEVLLYDDWAFRKIEGKFWTFGVGVSQQILPSDMHHLVALYRLDQTDPIKWCSNSEWTELNRQSGFALSTPKLRAVKLVKDEAQGGNVMKLLFGPAAAGGEVVYYSYTQIPSVTSLANVPAFLHEAVSLKVIAEISPTVTAPGVGAAVAVTDTYERNIKRYDKRIKELWINFSDIPIQAMKIEMDEATVRFHKAARRIVGV